MTKLEIRAPDIARVETAIARSDRRGADVIEASFRSGGLFDAWRDGFSVQRWEEAFRQAGFDLGEITGSIQKGTPLPWEHIDVGVTAGFLHSEREAAAREEFTADCRQEGCQFCGLQDHPDLPCPDIPELPVDIPVSSRKPRSTPENYRRYRLIYHRGPESRFHSHLSVMGVLERALRRLGVPLEFTQGFKPHVRLVASPPLAVGITSQAEYLDFGLAANWSARLLRRLKEALPFGFQVLKVIDLPAGQPSIGALDTFLYKARGKGGSSRVDYSGAIESLWAAETIPILRTGPRKARAFDARPSLWKLEQDHDTILIGIKASGGPIPRSDDILRLLLLQDDDSGLLSTADILATWDIERLGMWWDMEGVLRSPAEAIKSNEISYGKAR
jgi:radical SAM-linked protein